MAASTDSQHQKKIVIAGSGSIGCYVGGMLTSRLADVHFLARPRIYNELQTHGLTLTDWSGKEKQLAPTQFVVTQEESCLKDADMILVCVKSKDTHEMAETILKSGNAHATIFSFQNGVRNVDTLRDVLPYHTVLPVMVPYNVVHQGQGHFHCGTEGALMCQTAQESESLLTLAEEAQLSFELHQDMHSILWGKLLLNLNNPINALAGIPLKAELEDKAYRSIYKMCLMEGLAVLSAANISIGKVAAVPLNWIPTILGLPNILFKLIAKQMLTIDPQARSSMWEDLEQGRTVEVDFITGEIVRLGKELGIPTPMNERVMMLVKQAEVAQAGSPSMDASEIRGVI